MRGESLKTQSEVTCQQQVLVYMHWWYGPSKNSLTTLDHQGQKHYSSMNNEEQYNILTGALTHNTNTYGKSAHIFINYTDIPSDSNLTLNVLMSTLEAYVREHNVLPEVLYLQFDNCWRENKNVYVLSFAYLLVAMGIIKKVTCFFYVCCCCCFSDSSHNNYIIDVRHTHFCSLTKIQ